MKFLKRNTSMYPFRVLVGAKRLPSEVGGRRASPPPLLWLFLSFLFSSLDLGRSSNSWSDGLHLMRSEGRVSLWCHCCKTRRREISDEFKGTINSKWDMKERNTCWAYKLGPSRPKASFQVVFNLTCATTTFLHVDMCHSLKWESPFIINEGNLSP